MSAWSDLRERLRVLIFRRSEERELGEELAFHIEQETERLLREGLSPRQARRRALIAFGGVERTAERVREARGTLWLENAARDVRLAWRGLRRAPGFTVVAVLTLGVGIGATTAVFALANWLLLRPVPGVAAPEELVVVRLESAPGSGYINTISQRHVEELRVATPSLSGLATHHRRSLQGQVEDGEPFSVDAALVEGDYFGVLGVRPRLGRWFTEEERSPAAAGDVAVVSERFWSARLGRIHDVVGATVHLNGGAYRVVGVLPAGFHGIERTGDVDVWLPLAAYGRVSHRGGDTSEVRMFYELVGRLDRGATSVQAEEQLRAAMAGLLERQPELREELAEFPPRIYPAVGVPVSVRDQTARTVRLLLGVVSVLLLIACANVANLLLFRGLSRQGETAVRRALGGSSARLMQQQVAEGALLSLLAGAAGVGLAVALARVLEGQSLLGLPPVEDLPLDWRVIAFAVGGALLAGTLATGLPALAALRSNALATVRSGERWATGRGTVTRGGLTVLQIGASLTLLIGALLLVRTVRNLGAVDLGVEPDAVLVFGYDPSPQGYGAEAATDLRRRFLEEAEALGGIESAAMASFLPIVSRGGMIARLALPGDGAELVTADRFDVSASYFETIGTRLVAGRGFSAEEQHQPAEAGPGVVLSVAAARALFGDANAVGRSVELRIGGGVIQQMVIGVAEEVQAAGPRIEPWPAVYLPLGAAAVSRTHLLVRSALRRGEMDRMVRDALAGLDPAIPFFHAGPLTESVDRWMAEERLLARLLRLFAALAATLSGIGLYGVVAYSVARRRREIGIRVALGASGRSVVGLVGRQALGLTAAGVLVGAVGGYGLSRLLSSRLFGVTALDPLTYLAGAGLLAAVALAASALPARSAVAVDPVTTLKTE